MTSSGLDMPIVVERDGHAFTVYDSEPTASWRFWQDWWATGEWESELLYLVDEHLGPDGLLIDVGAWVGPVTLWAARVPERMVVAIEPDPMAFSLLFHNLEMNGFSNVVAIEAAATNHFGTTMLHSVKDRWGTSESSTLRTGGEELRVAAVDLVSLLRTTPRPTLVKMDIEGGEVTLFPRLGAFLRERGIPLLLSLHVPVADLGPEWDRWTAERLSRAAGESYFLRPGHDES